MRTHGFITSYTVFILSIIAVIVAILSSTILTEISVLDSQTKSQKAYYAADTGVACAAFFQREWEAFSTTSGNVPTGGPGSGDYSCAVGGFSTSPSTECEERSYNFSLEGFNADVCANVTADVSKDASQCVIDISATGKDVSSCSTTGNEISKRDIQQTIRTTLSSVQTGQVSCSSGSIPSPTNAIAVDTDFNGYTCGVTSTGSLNCEVSATPSMTDAVDVGTARASYICAARSNGELACSEEATPSVSDGVAVSSDWGSYTCGLSGSGSINCQSSFAPSVSNPDDVGTAKDNYTCAVRSSGSIECTLGGAPDVSDAVAVSTERDGYTCGAKANGEIQCTQDNVPQIDDAVDVATAKDGFTCVVDSG